MRIRILFSALIYFVISQSAQAQELSYPSYNIGNPSFQEIWVDPVSGSDSNSGNSRTQALKTLTAAWQRIPQGSTLTNAYKILLMPGSFVEDSIPNYWENRHGTYSFPILIQSADGPGTVTLKGDINAFNIDYLYLIGFSIIPDPAGDAFHCEQCEHILLRNMIFSGGNRLAHETIKVNQSQYIYIEDSDINGADDNAIDFVAVQYGHIVRNKIHNAEDWCVYVKGGSAKILIEANRIYECGTGGFTAGQGTGLEFMTSPWLHYEAYDVKVINNLIYDISGAGLGVNGGYNILLAHNTMFRVGARSHALEIVYGFRSCDGNSVLCSSYLAEGGWGTSVTGTEGEPIPNKNIYVYNNIIYNPAGFQSGSSHFAIYGPRTTANGSNLPATVRTDTNIVIKGNLIWNGSASTPLGIEEPDQGCRPDNVTCNEIQIFSDNYINTHLPTFIDVHSGDFRAANGSPVETLTPASLVPFNGADRQTPPLAEAGNLSNSFDRDYSNLSRSGRNRIGAFAGSLRSQTSADAYLPWNSYLNMINIVELANKGSSPIDIVLTVYNTEGQGISQANLSLSSHAQQDVILNSLTGFPTNSYGLVAIDCASTDLVARLSVYKQTKGGSNDYDFAYSSSLLQPITGTSNLSFNTMQPSANPMDSDLSVTNWLSITNPDPDASHSYTIYRYDQSGTLIKTSRVSATPFGRVDLEGGHEYPGRLKTGLNRIVPDDPSSPYFANMVRYGQDRGLSRDYQFAYPIIATAGGESTQYVPVSSGGGAQNWVEIVNVSDSNVNASIQAYNSSGIAAGELQTIAIPSHAQFHFNASAILGTNASGILKIVSSSPSSLAINSLFYFFKAYSSISSMYGIDSISESNGNATGSYNLYLGMANWLKIANLSGQSRNATIRIYQDISTLSEQTITLGPLGTAELPLHERSRFSTSSNTYGLIEVVGEGISSHVLRIRPSTSEINFIFPTKVQ